MPLLSPECYAEASVRELLEAAALGLVGLDRRWLGAILARGDAAAPDLLAFLRDEAARKQDLLDLDQDLLAIVRALASPAWLEVLVELARRHRYEFPDLLVDAFRAVGAAAVEPLLTLRGELEDPWEVDALLAGLGVRDARILRALEEELRRDPARGALLLEIYGDPAARAGLQAALRRSRDPEQRAAIEDALASLEGPSQVEPPEPFDIWSRYPAEASPEFAELPQERLEQLLASPEPKWRRGAVEELMARGASATALARVEKMAQEDPDPEVRGACWKVLGRAGVKPADPQTLLEKLADRSRPAVEREGLLMALAESAADPAVRRWILEYYDRPETRAVALEVMRWSGDARFATLVREHLDDADPQVRRQAVLGAATFQMRGEMGRLEKAFSDPAVRREALLAYAWLKASDQAPGAVHSILHEIERLAGGLSLEEAEAIQNVLRRPDVTDGEA